MIESQSDNNDEIQFTPSAAKNDEKTDTQNSEKTLNEKIQDELNKLSKSEEKIEYLEFKEKDKINDSYKF